MSISYFSTGGGVAHKVRVTGSQCKFSVWFDANGQYVDAQRIDARQRAYPVTAAQRAALARMTRHYIIPQQ